MSKPNVEAIRSKPNVEAIRRAFPLSKRDERGLDALAQCNICGRPSAAGMDVMRECDERDKPVAGLLALVFIGRGDEHASCRKVVEDHPRLYEAERPEPGHMPAICTECVHRFGLVCTSPKARANGGTGISISLERPGIYRGVICIRGAGGQNLAPPREPVACSGREAKS